MDQSLIKVKNDKLVVACLFELEVNFLGLRNFMVLSFEELAFDPGNLAVNYKSQRVVI